MNSENLNQQLVLQPLGYVRSPFKEKFGLPRQPGLITAVNAHIQISPEFADPESFSGLEEFSHIWLTFIFHQSIAKGWKSKVRPPRLGGNKKIGVFASRSPFRPNLIGQSVVALKKIQTDNGISLEIECPDLVDGTPIVDIKPYVAYCDSIADAISGYATVKPSDTLVVKFPTSIKRKVDACESKYPGFQDLIREVIGLNPAPAYQNSEQHREYGLKLYDYNIRYAVEGNTALLIDIE
ncbi:MAG: tRNA (N6-threonylcarbamoyladenosine(37)-N6)-methyltransferase TrmO [Oleiphilus sp.]|nr:MAG: tRNA (N6-threonylcarbamoyladenosine(37)-N6)-methyltransferase TrmO [Oleiphilus sp.]